MKWRLLTLMILGGALLSGCVAGGDFCDIARPMYMQDMAVLDWLHANDDSLLRAIVSHNEKTAKCP